MLRFRNAGLPSGALIAMTLASAPGRAAKLRPPSARQVPHLRTLHGERFEDPWFWLRERDDPEVRAYLEAENAYTEAMMAPTRALQDDLYRELLARVREDDESVPYRRGGWRYFTRTVQGAQHKIHLRRPLGEGAEQVLLDLNALGRAEKFIALGAFEPSDDGARLAYSLDTTGFREYTLRIVDLATGAELAPPIPKATSVAWAADGETLFYTVEDATKRSFRAYRTRLDGGSAELVHEEGDERFEVEVERSRSRGYLALRRKPHHLRGAPTCRRRRRDADGRAAPRRDTNTRSTLRRHLLGPVNDTGRNFPLCRARRLARAGSWRAPPRASRVPRSWRRRLRELLVATSGRRPDALPDRRAAGRRRPPVAIPESTYAVCRPNDVYDTDTLFRYLHGRRPRPTYDYDMAERPLLRKRDEVLGYDRTPTSWSASRRRRATARWCRSRSSTGGGWRGRPHPLLLDGYGAYGIPQAAGFDSEPAQPPRPRLRRRHRPRARRRRPRQALARRRAAC